MANEGSGSGGACPHGPRLSGRYADAGRYCRALSPSRAQHTLADACPMRGDRGCPERMHRVHRVRVHVERMFESMLTWSRRCPRCPRSARNLDVILLYTTTLMIIMTTDNSFPLLAVTGNSGCDRLLARPAAQVLADACPMLGDIRPSHAHERTLAADDAGRSWKQAQIRKECAECPHCPRLPTYNRAIVDFV